MMIVTRFTCGPWRACEDPDCGPSGCGNVYDDRGRLIGTAFSRKDAGVTFALDADHFVTSEEMRANTRLFAAGPAMVKALVAAGQALRSYQHGNSATDLAKEIADACDIALAHAVGSAG